MPSNRPLPDILVSGRPSRSANRVLTPRTPHSRAGRAEEGFTEVELDALRDDDVNDYRSHLQQQSQPLLSPGYRSRGDDFDSRRTKGTQSVKHYAQLAINNIPLIAGLVLAVTLLALIAISLNRPGALEAAVLDTPVDALSSGAVAGPTTKASPTSPSSSAETTTSIPIPSQNALISYENYTSFPLTGDEYRAECTKLMSGFMHHGDYWDPPRMGPIDVQHHEDDTATYHLPEGGLTKVCASTITYMLDGRVGLTADLALMAQAAAFARERNRTFLVDDTHWNRGKWTDHFQNIRALNPGPEPGCRAPPPQELVACPRTARHWVISSRTAMYHMGHPFSEEYENPFGHHLNRLKPIFERAQVSFVEVIRPNARNAALIRAAREELVSILSLPPPPPASAESQDASTARQRDITKNPTLYIGVHIRRGDGRPSAISFYPDNKIPLEKFVSGARQAWDRFFGNASMASPPIAPVAGTEYADIGDVDSAHEALSDVSSKHDGHFPAPPIMWLASDSPPAAREFVARFPSATAMFSLEHSTNTELRALAPVHEYVQWEFDAEPLEERVRLTRGMVVDLAMASGLWAWPGEVVPGAVVCGEGSNVCRVAAFGLGFKHAFGFEDGEEHHSGDPDQARARWVDVDVEGRIVPAWHAFGMH